MAKEDDYHTMFHLIRVFCGLTHQNGSEATVSRSEQRGKDAHLLCCCRFKRQGLRGNFCCEGKGGSFPPTASKRGSSYPVSVLIHSNGFSTICKLFRCAFDVAAGSPAGWQGKEQVRKGFGG